MYSVNRAHICHKKFVRKFIFWHLLKFNTFIKRGGKTLKNFVTLALPQLLFYSIQKIQLSFISNVLFIFVRNNGKLLLFQCIILSVGQMLGPMSKKFFNVSMLAL